MLCAATAADEAAVTVRQEPITFPVVAHKPRANWSAPPAERLAGKETYTTTAVILENQYLKVTVLPQLGGRVMNAVFKPTGREMFWQNRQLSDNVPWMPGGARFSFPFHEHGRHYDETAGYVIVRGQDGSATVAVDMRFEQFMKAAELNRYGRATNLQLRQYITLRPHRASFTYAARVENPTPIRLGFKLWFLARYDNVAGAMPILPAAATTGHGAPSLDPWPTWGGVDRSTTGDWADSRFAVGIQHDFGGFYYPKEGVNHLLLASHTTAPGAKLVIYKSGPERGYYEVWRGNHEVFEETGRLLPALCSYRMDVECFVAPRIGKADYANQHAAIRVDLSAPGTARVALFPLYLLAGAKLHVGDGPAVAVDGAPDRPFVQDMKCDQPRPRVRLLAADGTVLVDQQFPLDVGPMPQEQFQRVQERVKGAFAGGRGLFAEAMPLPSEHWLTLPRYRKELLATAQQSNDLSELNDTALRLIQLPGTDDAVLAATARALAIDARNPQANLYRAMALMQAGQADKAGEHLGHAQGVPGGLYLHAMRCIGQGDHIRAHAALKKLIALPLEADHGPAGTLMTPGAAATWQQPRLMYAGLLKLDDQEAEMRNLLDSVLADDPACTEAHVLRQDSGSLATLYANNEPGRKSVDRALSEVRRMLWRGIGRPQ
mgnify:CR=1 FL=1